MNEELRDAARRVTGYVRAWQLLSNTDDERLGEVSVMPPGTQEPMTFLLLSADLESLASYASESGVLVPEGELERLRADSMELAASSIVGAVPIARAELERLRAASAELDKVTSLRGQLQAVWTIEETDSVTISKEEYLDLQDSANELAALHAAGVDNWEGYAEARSNR